MNDTAIKAHMKCELLKQYHASKKKSRDWCLFNVRFFKRLYKIPKAFVHEVIDEFAEEHCLRSKSKYPTHLLEWD